MTRWARGGTANKKKEHEGSSWQQIKKTKNESESGPSSSTKHKNQDVRKQDLFDSGMDSFKQGMKSFKKGFSDFDKQKHNFKRFDKSLHGIDKTDGPKFKAKEKHGKAPKKKGLADMIQNLKEEFSDEIGEAEKKEMETVVKKAERSEERRVKRINQRQDAKICYKCRERGHDMSECTSSSKQTGTGICFKCGSTEHSMNRCPSKLPPGEFPYAKCFICEETGHLSKQCPDNPRGLYPNGGCCKTCGSVEHFNKDCPDLQEKQGIQNLSLALLDSGTSADAELSLKSTQKSLKKKQPKVVKF